MKRKIFLAASFVFFFAMSASAQKSNADYLDELKASGYPELATVSFKVTKKNYAITSLQKDKKDKIGLLHFATAVPTKDGVNVGFKILRSCIPSEKNERMTEQVINVGGRKVEVYYQCAVVPGEPVNHELFIVKSAAGNEFVKKVFIERKFVFVYLNNLPVPFETEGFAEVLEALDGKAL